MGETAAKWKRVRDLGDADPFNTKKLYRMKHRRECDHIFSKVGGCLFVDLHALENLLEGCRLGEKPEK